jgi:DNA-binding MarR family transcriptional regulator
MGPAAGAAAEVLPARVSEDLVELLTVMQRRVARGLAAVLADDGATIDGYRLLRALVEGEGRSMGELVAALHLPAPTLTRLVDAAVDAALVYRLPDPQDGRKVLAHLSGVGRTRLARLEALVQAHESALAAAVGADRIDALRRALTDVAQAGARP